MTPLEPSVSDATIWSITLESSIMILEVSFTLMYDVYIALASLISSSIDDCNISIVQANGVNIMKTFFVSHAA
jgi:hypothetical protein